MNQFERRRLERDHRQLDQEIKEAVAHPHADPMAILHLKKRKLAIKDRLHRITTIQNSVQHAA